MKRIITAILTAAVAVSAGTAAGQSTMKPPVAKKEPKVLKIHGYEIVDDYAWLRDRNEPRRADIIDYLTAENAYTDAMTAGQKQLEETLYKEMLGRIKQTDNSVPNKRGKFWYFTRTEEGKQYPVFLRSKTRDGKDAETLLDVNEMAKGHKYFAVGMFNVSNDGTMLAYSTDTTGYRQYTLQIKDLRTGETLPDKIERATSAAWANDGNKTIFVSTEDPEDKRSNQVWRHTVGTNDNKLVFEEKDPLFAVYAFTTLDSEMVMLHSNAATMSETRYIKADQPNSDFKVILPREKDHEYDVDHWNGNFYITTNKNAENFRVVKAPINDPSEKNWVDFVAHDPKVKVAEISFFKDHAVVSELENGLEYIRVKDLRTKRADVRIPTDEEVYTMNATGNSDFETSVVRYNYSSMITPASVYEYDVKTGKRTLLKQQEIPSGYDKSGYETKRVWATARDGVKVPISLIMKKGTKLDGRSPMLLYAYGSYGISMTPSFSTNRLSLVDRGMIYAIAHIRGGSELGEKWRQDGRMFKKLNTFYDFIDSAKWLTANKYTSSDRLVIQGGSAGGLLLGGVMNMSPETFHAAIVQVPFVDVMNTMLDETLPLTTGEWIEWGNPNEKEAWDYMIKYSPYENIKAQKYPHMLVEISLYDSQVLYWEGAKYAAKLRATKTDDNELLLKTNMSAGHGGASGRYDRLKEIAFDYAWALSKVGIKK